MKMRTVRRRKAVNWSGCPAFLRYPSCFRATARAAWALQQYLIWGSAWPRKPGKSTLTGLIRAR